MNNITIYSKKNTPRLTYTFEVVFNQLLGVEFVVTDKLINFQKAAVKINYNSELIENSISITPEGLLEEDYISARKNTVFWEKGIPYLFKTSQDNLINYDIFSGIFYLISRYEEYLPNETDQHGRFQAENSIAYQNNFLHLPIVDIWVNELKDTILEKYPELIFQKKKFKYINTVDIDFAYAYKGKPTYRNLGSFGKNIVNQELKEAKNKLNYFTKKIEDPFDTYKLIAALSKKHNVQTIYFFLLGNYGGFDKSYHPKNKTFKKLIKHLQKDNLIGIHPSYKSNSKSALLKKEREYLEKITANKIAHSRQHFLKMSLPYTYENLIENGIENDYTMGYASQIGFRAGTSNSFPFFNLQTNQKTTLLVHPFQVMDVTLKKYLNYSSEKAIEEIEKMVAEVKAVNGTFTTLWHNSSLSSEDDWAAWIDVYKKIFEITAD